MSNRVDDLEATVSELRAAVDGLTEELVETKERVRQLEAQLDGEADSDAAIATPGSGDDAGIDPAHDEEDDDGVKSDEAQTSDEEATSESDESDIIVA